MLKYGDIFGLSVWETAKIFGKWRRSVGNGSNMWGNDLMTNVKNVETLRDLGNGQNNWEMAYTWCRLKYLKIGLTKLEMS